MSDTKQENASKAPAAGKIFVVEVTFEVPVVAESAEEAERLAEDGYARDEWRDGGGSFSAEYRAWEMRAPAPKDWSPCLPWGGDGETTIAAYLVASQSEPAEGRPSPEIPAIPDSKG